MASRARIRILMPDSDAASIPRRLDYLIRLPGGRPLPGRAPETTVYSTYALNAGQIHYNHKDFKRALERWLAAQKLAPDDFQIAKKLVQAHNGAGNDAEAAKARDLVFALWKAGKAGKPRDFVFDQFDVGKYHVYAFETFDTSGDVAYVYRFDVTISDKPIGNVNLKTSEVIREAGKPYLLGMDKGGTHSQLGKIWTKLPTYKEVKPLVIDAIKAKF